MTAGQHAALAGFGFALGASVGSFLNVCIWRLPRGESLVRPPSRCPRCGSAIAARDNIPVAGWLLLRGRCRWCACPIPARYPLVEGAVGLLFAWVILADLGSDPFEGNPAGLLAALGYHLALVALLVTAAMIVRDECLGTTSPAPWEPGRVSPRLRPASAALAATVAATAAATASDPVGWALNVFLLALFVLRAVPPRPAPGLGNQAEV